MAEGLILLFGLSLSFSDTVDEGLKLLLSLSPIVRTELLLEDESKLIFELPLLLSELEDKSPLLSWLDILIILADTIDELEPSLVSDVRSIGASSLGL